jgi:putative NIF3 family GTP cyclohydrolase 1 type 2
MTIQQIYDLAVKMGIKADLRGEKRVKENLARLKAKYEKMDKEAKAEFDKEKLTNPYSDSRILFSGGKKEIKKVLVGIDMEGEELLLADKIGNIDLVIAHHPEGSALADLHGVMDLQAEVLAGYGVPINIAESVIRPRISEVGRGVGSANHNRSVDIAKILGMNFMCLHTPCDNLGANYLEKLFKKTKPEFVEDILKILKEIPEFKEAINRKAGPKLFVGNPEDRCGKVVVTEFTGGTSGSKDIYEKMSQYGIGTVIGMHMSEEHRKEAEKAHINVVIAGHMASDSLGLNLFLDELEKKGIKIVPISGLIRIKRK